MWHDERGAAAAEFAVVVPAVILLVALTAGTLAATGRLVRLEQATALAARLVAREEAAPRAMAVLAAMVPGATGGVRTADDLVCVDAHAPLPVPLPLPPLRASSCALDGGR